MIKIFTLALIVLISNPVQATPVTELTITGGQFTVENIVSHLSNITPGAFASISVDGSYDGSPVFWDYSGGVAPREADYLPYSIAAFEFSFFWPIWGVYCCN